MLGRPVRVRRSEVVRFGGLDTTDHKFAAATQLDHARHQQVACAGWWRQTPRIANADRPENRGQRQRRGDTYRNAKPGGRCEGDRMNDQRDDGTCDHAVDDSGHDACRAQECGQGTQKFRRRFHLRPAGMPGLEILSRPVSTSRTTVNKPSKNRARGTVTTKGLNNSCDCDRNSMATVGLSACNGT